MNKKDWPQAVSRWQKVFMTFKDQTPPEGYILLSMAHRFQGQFDQAEAIIANGMKILPVNIGILSEYAEIAKARKDWPEAARRLEILKSVKSQLSKLQKHIAESQTDYIRYKLRNLGFHKKAIADLKTLAACTDNPYTRNLAAWELSLWYADAQNSDCAQKCLDMLKIVKSNEKNTSKLNQAIILESESLDLTGNRHKAKSIVSQDMNQHTHPDLFLAASNLESDPAEKIQWINKELGTYQLCKIGYSCASKSLVCNELAQATVKDIKARPHQKNTKVSVLVDARSAQDTIESALESISGQTWTNLEILAVVDPAEQEVFTALQEYARKDTMLRILNANSDIGMYGALNLALQQCTGDFVTCQMASEWSHPQKIEIQMTSLLDTPGSIANISQHASITSDLNFIRLLASAQYIHDNISSLLFHRAPVLKKLGCWDDVHFGADHEMVKRIICKFGKDSIKYLKTGPVSFKIDSRGLNERKEESQKTMLIASSFNEYLQSSEHYHNSTDNLYYSFQQKKRPFPTPCPVTHKADTPKSHSRHFDVIIASEFMMRGGNCASVKEEIKAQKNSGLTTGIVQMSHYDYPRKTGIPSIIREEIDGEKVQIITCEEEVSCDLLILRYPPILQEHQVGIPVIKAKDIRIIVNIPPMRTYGETGEFRYSIKQCHQHVLEYFEKPGIWHPIGPLVRKALLQHHADEMSAITIANEDWVNIINVQEWKRPARPARGRATRIGRHSRDTKAKWPNNQTDLLSAYPDSSKYEIHVLGGANIPSKTLGKLPENWIVTEFGTMHPKDFLSSLDVFVYYAHPEWVESFGRTIIEAMAVGVPVILPPEYKPLFADAAVYAEFSEVCHTIDKIMSCDSLYNQQVQNAYKYIENYFSYDVHINRIEKIRHSIYKNKIITISRENSKDKIFTIDNTKEDNKYGSSFMFEDEDNDTLVAYKRVKENIVDENDVCASYILKTMLQGNIKKSIFEFKSLVENTITDKSAQDIWTGAFYELTNLYKNLSNPKKLNALKAKHNESWQYKSIYRKIIPSGMAWSGSGALTAYLREFNNVNYVDVNEFCHIEGPVGLMQLRTFQGDKNSFILFIMALFSYTFFGYGTTDNNDIKYKLERSKIKTRRLINLAPYAQAVYYFLKKARFLHRSDNTIDFRVFYCLSNILIDKICESFANSESSYVLMDNTIHMPDVDNIEYLDKTHLFCVVRDPRSNYVARIQEDWKFGPGILAAGPAAYAVSYKIKRKATQLKMDSLSRNANNVEIIQFEDFVASKTCREQIARSLGLDPENRDRRRYFNPDKSIRNISNYKTYPSQNEINTIKNKLPQYLWNAST